MGLCRTSRVGFQNETIIEETLTANYIIKENKRTKYLEKSREYKKNMLEDGTKQTITEKMININKE